MLESPRIFFCGSAHTSSLWENCLERLVWRLLTSRPVSNGNFDRFVQIRNELNAARDDTLRKAALLFISDLVQWYSGRAAILKKCLSAQEGAPEIIAQEILSIIEKIKICLF